MAENVQGAYTSGYGVERRHRHVSGNILLPVAGPDGTPPQAVKLFAAYEMEEVHFSLAKEGAPPIIPSPIDLTTNHVFLDGHRAAIIPPPKASGVGHTWAVSGVYRYAMTTVIGMSSDMPTGRMPMDPTPGSASDYTIPSGNFNISVLGNSGKKDFWNS